MTEEEIQISLSKIVKDLSLLIKELHKFNGKLDTKTISLIDDINRLSVAI